MDSILQILAAHLHGLAHQIQKTRIPNRISQIAIIVMALGLQSRAKKRAKRKVRIAQIEEDNNNDEEGLNYWMERKLRREAAEKLAQKNVEQQQQHHKETVGTFEKHAERNNETKDSSDSGCTGDVAVDNQEKMKVSTEARSSRSDSIAIEGERIGSNDSNNNCTSSKGDGSIPQAKAPAATKTTKEIEASRIERMRIKNQQRKAARKAKKAVKN